MFIKCVKIYNYRNYELADVNLSKNLNVIIGDNAQGKTNLLEAIYFCAIGKSLRTSKDKEIINWSKDIAKIQLILQREFTQTKIEIIFSKFQKKTIKINDIPIKKISNLLGELNCVFFAPSELKLIKESPEDRRRFMDIDISQTSKQYFQLLTNYDKILKNRNKLLKTSKTIESLNSTISIWNEQLSTCACKITHYRLDFLKKLLPYAQKAQSYLSNSNEHLNLEYCGNYSKTENETKQLILTQLQKSLEKDYKLGFTTVGPHRDDIKITVNDIDVRTYGSQGQQRTTALALKLAELEIIKNQIGEYPVLLLDDVLSELDENRRNKLINFSQKTQTIITCTDFSYSKIEYKELKIKNGKLI